MQGFITYLNIFVILLSKRSSAADLQYERCEPGRCSRGPNISYPVYLWGRQESYCSYPYPGFQLNCSAEGLTVANFSGDEYVVEEISYVNRSLHVVNAAVSGSGTDCIRNAIRNMTLPSRFSYVRTTNLSIFSNCTGSLPDKLSGYRFGCDNWGIALLGTDEEELMKDATEYCGTSVVAPVEDYGIGNDGVVNTTDLLRTGFALDWAASDCSVCEGSGGRCGYNSTSLQFRCFCTDGPHSRSCKPGTGGGRSRTIIIIVVSIISCLILVAAVAILLRRKQRKKRPQETADDEEEIGSADSLQYAFEKIRAATNNFSEDNKLGHGGFGAVYKGKLEGGEEIAVKRLSRGSAQGDLEFKNEVLLVAKLQHRNLVKLFGFAIDGLERLLIYEFVQNASLDRFIFDSVKRSYIDWDRRCKIIGGIARGLLYLQEDSRFRIIHRDLKASNILLDGEMNPKIADFGMARLFEANESQDNTSRVVGTYGYMAPEYALHGHLSLKIDVFSFGVLVLEVVSGQKNNSFLVGGKIEDMLSFAWRSFRVGIIEDLIDPTLRSGPGLMQDMLRCIHIGLLCVQEGAADRPTMSSVVLMLNGPSVTMPIPSEPPFYMSRKFDSTSRETGFSRSVEESGEVPQADADPSRNDASITELYPR